MGNLKMKEPGINPLPQWQTCVVVAYDMACKKQCFPFPPGLKHSQKSERVIRKISDE